MAERSLKEYRRKRDPARTPEPYTLADAAVPPAVGAARFVIQQHAARALHWDFRLEIDGVLVSWAVPRGPSIDPKEKRLAVQTEDHPLEYGDFEGRIPAGNYGAGAVIMWDQGTYHSVDGVAPSEGMERGKLDLMLQGHKLHGRFALVRTKSGNGKQWLLFKKADGQPTAPEPVQVQPASIFSGLTVEEMRTQFSRTEELTTMATAAGAAPLHLDAARIKPMLAETAEGPFSRAGWIFELKHDGIRVLIERAPERPVRIFSRTRRDITTSFPEIAEAGARLPCDAFVLDGELVTLDERGASSFERLQRRLGLSDRAAVTRARIEVPVVVYALDLLGVADYDLRPLPLLTRKELLQRLVPRLGVIRYSDHVADDGIALFEAANAHALEGVMGKRAASTYQAGRRSRDWLKVKALRSADLAIVGFIPGRGNRSDLGALMLAWRENGGLAYAGNVGTGFDHATLDELHRQLTAAQRPAPAFTGFPRELARSAVFVEPKLVAEIRFSEATDKGYLRQPVFVRLRDDKLASDCDHAPARRSPPEPAAVVREPAPAPALRLSNLDKLFWPGDGYTKGDLLDYYRNIWPLLAPYLRDRPVVLTRYPDGIDGKSFFQKNAPDFTPDWVRTHRIDDTDYFVCNDLDTLLYVINSGCIPLHVWSARLSSIHHPDWAIIDLDPKGAPFGHVVKLAKQLHRILEPLQVAHFVKTSGQDGLHVLMPLGAHLTHDEAKTFAEVLARLVAAECPDIATIARPLSARGGKVYVDFLQNGFGKTIAGAFSVRPRPGAPVSTPLEWRELTARLDPKRFTIKTVPARFARRTDPMRHVLETHVDVRAALAALAERMAVQNRRKAARRKATTD